MYFINKILSKCNLNPNVPLPYSYQNSKQADRNTVSRFCVFRKFTVHVSSVRHPNNKKKLSNSFQIHRSHISRYSRTAAVTECSEWTPDNASSSSTCCSHTHTLPKKTHIQIYMQVDTHSLYQSQSFCQPMCQHYQSYFSPRQSSRSQIRVKVAVCVYACTDVCVCVLVAKVPVTCALALACSHFFYFQSKPL